MRYAMLLSYDGTHFSGWQKQKNARTVQEELEGAAEKIFGAPIKVTGSGRTDAGVHAQGQVCHFDAETGIPAQKIKDCFNCILPCDVRVLKSAEAPADFDCTRNAKKKTYRYTAYYSQTELPLLSRYSARLKAKPNISAMQAAARFFEGEHDFKAFCAAGSSAKTSVRTVYSVAVRKKEIPNGVLYEIEVCGNGFLYNMVRIMAGELFAIGCGKGTENLTLAFQTGARKHLAKTMPACGLCLVGAEYAVPLF